MKTRIGRQLLTASLALLILSGCSPRTDSPPKNQSVFRILSGSENESLESIIQDFARQEKITIEVTYKGSVDIMRELANGANSPYDAVWPANSLWILLGDTSNLVTNSKSIMRSPVILGVKKSVADRLGWVGKDVVVDDILTAAEAGQLRFMMTNATQSDSGASAYLGFLYAFAGHPDVLTSTDLQDPDVRDKIKRILGTVDRTAGDSGYLKELFLKDYDAYDAMVNYESEVIEANLQLVSSGREPLYAVYPIDGIALADSPFAYIDKKDSKKAETFQNLQKHLLSTGVQEQLLKLGRRAGPGLNPDPATIDFSVFNPDWGIDTQRILTPVKIPAVAVIREALSLYQTTFRKPSFTVYALDFSGSMAGSGEGDLKAAMRLLLDQNSASQYLLQASPDDVTIVILFNDSVADVWTIKGNDPAVLLRYVGYIDQKQPGGGTDIYSPVIRGLEEMAAHGIDGYFPAIVLMSDGRSLNGKNFGDLKSFIEQSSIGPIPVYAITFGDAATDQLQDIAELTSGAVFDGKSDLAGAFRKVKGYN